MGNYWIVIVLALPGLFAVDSETQQRIETLRKQIQLIDDIVENQEMALVHLKSKIHTSVRTLKELVHENKEKRQTTNPKPVVAFTASTSQNQVFAHNEKIVYDTVETNVPGGYDNTTGIFTCPVSGYYEFAASIIANYDKLRVDGAIVRNGGNLVHLNAHGLGFDCGANVIMVHCKQNSQVWVKHIIRNQGTTLMRGARPSYFSGHLIHAD